MGIQYPAYPYSAYPGYGYPQWDPNMGYYTSPAPMGYVPVMRTAPVTQSAPAPQGPSSAPKPVEKPTVKTASPSPEEASDTFQLLGQALPEEDSLPEELSEPVSGSKKSPGKKLALPKPSAPPLTREEKIGKQVGEMATELLEQNPQYTDKIERALKQLSPDALMETIQPHLETIHQNVYNSRVLRFMLKHLKGPIVRAIPPDLEPVPEMVNQILTTLEQKPEPKKFKPKSRPVMDWSGFDSLPAGRSLKFSPSDF